MSFYTSLNGLKNAQTELSVIANNLANAETTGFKKSRINFSDLVSGTASSNPKLIKGLGSTVLSIDQNFSLGPVQQTGSALDLAINGDGFFTAVSALSGKTFYTRNGNFSMDGGGFVLDNGGNRLQVLPVDAAGNVTSATPIDAQAPLVNAAGSDFLAVNVKPDGSMIASYADGSTQSIGVVALASFVAPSGLLQVGGQNWQATGISGAPVNMMQPRTDIVSSAGVEVIGFSSGLPGFNQTAIAANRSGAFVTTDVTQAYGAPMAPDVNARAIAGTL